MHDFLNDLDSGFLFLAFAGPSVLIDGPTLHAFHVDTVIKLRDDFFELGKEELDERIGVGIFFVCKVVLDPTKSFADSDKVVGAVIVGVAQRMEEVVHFLFNGLTGGEFVESKEIFFKI